MLSTGPKISVVVAVYNGEKTLQRCIDCFVSQTYQNRELIVIDGSSNDKTVDIISLNISNISYWESKPDRGIYHAWNKALDHVQGDWICFLGADDYFWESSVLEQVAAKIVLLPNEILVAYGRLALVDNCGGVLKLLGEPWQTAKNEFFRHMSIPHPGLMHRRSLFLQYGKFDESFRIAGDYELLLRVLKTSDASFIKDIITVGMQYGGISCDPKLATKILIEEARARRKNFINSYTYQWILYFGRAYLRELLRKIIGENALRFFAIFFGRMTGRPSAWDLPHAEGIRRPSNK